MSLVEVRGLTVAGGSGPILSGVDLAVAAGSYVGVVGASGSGKTTLALALLGHLRPGLTRTAGTVRAGDTVMLGPGAAPGTVRGRQIAYLPQDPSTALNPYRRVGRQLLDVLPVRPPRGLREQTCLRLLERAGLPAAGSLLGRWPHQLSGGQRQRLAIAVALALEPRALVLDEPTTGLDPSATGTVLDEIRRLHDGGLSIVQVSHDLTALRAAGRVVVLDGGRVVEDGPAATVLTAPVCEPARRIVAAARPAASRARPDAASRARPGAAEAVPVLRAAGLTAGHPGRPAVLRDVDLTARAGRAVAVLGVSGAGKTTLARCLAGLHHPAAGTLTLDGLGLPGDVRHRSRAQRAGIQLVAQDPDQALHPSQDVATAIGRPVTVFHGIRGPARHAEVVRLLDAVHLPAGYARRLPRELSGGQRQRVALARALAARPRVLICDEITSALDAPTRAGILDLLAGLAAETDTALVVITHDMSVVTGIADQVVLLDDGRVAEAGTVDAVLATPRSDAGRRLAHTLQTAAGIAGRP